MATKTHPSMSVSLSLFSPHAVPVPHCVALTCSSTNTLLRISWPCHSVLKPRAQRFLFAVSQVDFTRPLPFICTKTRTTLTKDASNTSWASGRGVSEGDIAPSALPDMSCTLDMSILRSALSNNSVAKWSALAGEESPHNSLVHQISCTGERSLIIFL